MTVGNRAEKQTGIRNKPMNEAVLMQCLQTGCHVTAEVQQKSLIVKPLDICLLIVQVCFQITL